VLFIVISDANDDVILPATEFFLTDCLAADKITNSAAFTILDKLGVVFMC